MTMVNIASAAAASWAEPESAVLHEQGIEWGPGLDAEESDHIVCGIDLSPLREDEILLASSTDRRKG